MPKRMTFLSGAARQPISCTFDTGLDEEGAEYRVAYLVPNPRRGEPDQETMLRLWYTGENTLVTMPEALAYLNAAKRRGYTAWVTDIGGQHVPVRGAARPYPGRYSIS